MNTASKGLKTKKNILTFWYFRFYEKVEISCSFEFSMKKFITSELDEIAKGNNVMADGINPDHVAPDLGLNCFLGLSV